MNIYEFLEKKGIRKPAQNRRINLKIDELIKIMDDYSEAVEEEKWESAIKRMQEDMDEDEEENLWI